MVVGGWDPTYWTPINTRAYLRGQKWAKPELIKEVRQRAMDGPELLTLAEEDLRDFGITNPYDLNEALQGLDSLRNMKNDEEEEPPLGLLPDIRQPQILSEGTHSDLNSSTSSRRSKDGNNSCNGSGLLIASTPPKPPSQPKPPASETPRRANQLLNGFNVCSPSAPPRRSAKSRSRSGIDDRQLRSIRKRSMMDVEKAQQEDAARAAWFREQDIMRSLTHREKQLRAAFKFINSDNNGVISYHELEYLVRMVFPKYGEPRIRELVASVMEECDANGDGAIGIDEWTHSKYASEILIPPKFQGERDERRELLTKAFMEADADGSGELDFKELDGLLAVVFSTLGPRKLNQYKQAIITECDKDRDNTITLEEFVKSEYANMLSQPMELEEDKSKREDKLRSAFYSVDTNRSGDIDYDELMKLLAKVLPGHEPESYEKYRDVIVAECDANHDGSITLQEFMQSSYANMLAGIEDDEVEKNQEAANHNEMVSHVNSLNKKRKHRSKNLKNKLFELEVVGAGEEDTRAQSPTTPSSTGSAKKRGARVPMHLLTNEEQEEMAQTKKILKVQGMLTGSTKSQLGRYQGPMEMERRYSAITDLFHKWDSSSIEGAIDEKDNGFIEESELKPVLQYFFGWDDDEADDNFEAIMLQIDSNSDGKLEWDEFVKFVFKITTSCSPGEFDDLVEYLHDCIGEVTEDSEYKRRDQTLADLFKFWDWDERGGVVQGEVHKVLSKYNQEFTGQGPRKKDKKKSYMRKLSAHKIDENSTKRFALPEFQKYFQRQAFRFPAQDFDLLVYRLKRCVETVQIQLHATRPLMRFRISLDNHLATTELQNLYQMSSNITPIIMYGTTYDPSRSLEKCAMMNECVLEPFILSHDKAEQPALDFIRERGFLAAAWIYIVLTEHHYPVSFLRQVGIRLQTQSKHIRTSFRLFIFAPYGKVLHFPDVIRLNALTVNVDNAQPPTKRAVFGITRTVNPTASTVKNSVVKNARSSSVVDKSVVARNLNLNFIM